MHLFENDNTHGVNLDPATLSDAVAVALTLAGVVANGVALVVHVAEGHVGSHIRILVLVALFFAILGVGALKKGPFILAPEVVDVFVYRFQAFGAPVIVK